MEDCCFDIKKFHKNRTISFEEVGEPVTLGIYVKAKYNRSEELSEAVNGALKLQADSDES